MGTTIAVAGFAFSAFCIWLMVRIINRRERWAKRTAWGVAAVLLLYPISLGPACRMAAGRVDLGYMIPAPRAWMSVYWPIGWLVANSANGQGRSGGTSQRPFFQRLVMWYVNLWLPPGTTVVIPAARNGETNVLVGAH